MTKQIIWKDLDKRYGLFTRRSTTLVDLATDGIIRIYSANTKINVVQKTVVEGKLYFRTESAVTQGLDWAFKASSFELPTELASLEPSKESFVDNLSSHVKNSKINTHSTTTPNKKIAKTPKASESEEKVSEERKASLFSAFKRFLGRKK